jgi:hypothetical protein
MQLQAAYPTPEHQAAADAITEFFSTRFQVDAVLVVNSCARGKATRDSCLDMNVLVQPEPLHVQRQHLEKEWEGFNATSPVIQSLQEAGQYSVVHLDILDGVFAPTERDEAAEPDSFELGVGNLLAYGVPVWQGSNYLARLKQHWLPYYSEELRRQRLAMVRDFCRDNLRHIPLYVTRGLYFQSFDRLYNAYREFLQALFIARRVYPIAYNKWIREQIEEILELPQLYAQLTHLFEIRQFESHELVAKAHEVEQLLEEYAPDPAA